MERILARGVVQGVGFRPTVARVARARGLSGWVRNTAEGVEIVWSGPSAQREAAWAALRAALPDEAQVAAWERGASAECPTEGFEIRASPLTPPARAPRLTPDFALCPECAAEVLDPASRRHRYPFTACTRCGPRASVVTGLPYDRERTTLAAFPLCAACAAEYADPADRRFHAQATCCPACGPRAWLERGDGQPADLAGLDALDAADAVGRLLLRGELVALQGLGGFQLCCDATDSAAVARLRERKRRPSKPLALMARDLEVIRRYAEVSPAEAELLTSAAAPIVLLRARPGAEPPLSSLVAPEVAEVGFMLPSTPLHLLALGPLARPIVCTSGNPSEEPPCLRPEEARARLGRSGIADWLLLHDRPIAARSDDSLARVTAGAARILRRARGYAPAALPLPPGCAAAPPILALGGHLKSTLGCAAEGALTLSSHQGDLGEPLSGDSWEAALERLSRLLAHRPAAVAVDLHPEYRSHQVGVALAQERSLPLIAVQHHHAHVAACLAEHGRPLDAPPVLGIALDGLGLGEGGELWGGELLLADYRASERLGRLRPAPLLGGERAAREPWRNLYAQLRAVFSPEELAAELSELSSLRAILTHAQPGFLERVLANPQLSPPASSCGRLFDAVAAALGIHPERIHDEGQAARALEAAIQPADRGETRAVGGYRFALGEGELPCLDPAPLWRPLLADLRAGVRVGKIAARFHVGLAEGLVALTLRLRERGARFDAVALSGGCFQNATLLELLSERLAAEGFEVLAPGRVPCHDGGLALGQAAVAAARLLG